MKSDKNEGGKRSFGQILTDVFKDQGFDILTEPEKRFRREQGVSLGELKSPLGQRIYSYREELTEELRLLAEEHSKAHDAGVHDSAECDRFHKALDLLGKRRDIFTGLLRQAITAEYPETLHPESGVRIWMKWDISVKPNYKAVKLFEENTLPLTLLSRIEDIFLNPPKGPFNPIERKIEPGEEVIGTITDTRIMALSALEDELRALGVSLIPDQKNFEGMEQWMETKTVGDLKQLAYRVDVLKRQQKVLSSIYWELVYDEVPEARQHDHVGLRKDWQLVSVPENEDAEIPAILKALFEAGGMSIRMG